MLAFGQYLQQCRVIALLIISYSNIILNTWLKLFVGDLMDENTLMKVFRGLNETTGVVLEYLQDAKVIMGIS